MSEIINGQVFVLGDNIDTDQIIPAGHLMYSLDDPEERKFYGRYALSGVPEEQSGLPEGGIPFTPEDQFESEFDIIVAGRNFGCGSSREHAPFALQQAGVQAVVSPSYARIFYRNAVDGGFVVPFESRGDLTEHFRTGDTAKIDRENCVMINERSGEQFELLELGEVAHIVDAGGIFDYARKTNMF